ncbi:MAG: GAP family protein [Cyanobacteria bacterium REEB67]|nr:GAP family protein [Cyanobacteria bacterium REEB67]
MPLEQTQAQAAAAAAPVKPEQNELCYGVFWGTLIVGALANIALVYFVAHNAIAAYSEHPINWLPAILNTLFLVMALSLLRAVVWGSFVMSAALANRTQSFKAQTDICQWARKYRRLLPGGASWATQAIIQRMLTKEQYKDAIALGSAEYETVVKKDPRDQSLANLCSCLGFANQMLNEQHRAIEWNEKAVDCYQKLFVELEKSKGMSKFAAKNVVDNLQLQYAQVLAALATSYLYTRNRVKAKEHLKNALAQARKAQDSPQKRDVIRVCEEQLGQLKHF